ncbi:rhodanese-like domain-containing protein [Sulfurimonas sp.]|uniref:rhodanese-like domain-containing protein n=1 Tax=Sulfurimonas sp. TaxID=2022749 RepID=UPI0035660208
MRKYLFILVFFTTLVSAQNFDTYLKSFDYESKTAMKIKTVEMLNMLEEGTVQVIDIRFHEEFELWNLKFTKNIPLNELPDRLNELDKSKLIVTVCPHNDRSNIARMFLTLKGYKARYLSDGLLTTVNYLKGDNAKEFLEEYKKRK